MNSDTRICAVVLTVLTFERTERRRGEQFSMPDIYNFFKHQCFNARLSFLPVLLQCLILFLIATFTVLGQHK